MTKFGEKLRELRQERGISQLNLAKHFSVSQSTIADWERGKVETDFETLIKLSKFFNVTTDYILGVAIY